VRALSRPDFKAARVGDAKVFRRSIVLACAAVSTLAAPSAAQAVVAAWGNVEGLRVDGEIFPFETSMCAVSDSGIARTQKEKQLPRYSRLGDVRTVVTHVGAYSITETITDTKRGEVVVDLSFTADSATRAGGYFCIEAPRGSYASVTALDEATSITGTMLPGVLATDGVRLKEHTGRGVTFEPLPGTSTHRIEIRTTALTPVLAGADRRRDGSEIYRALIPIIAAGDAGRSTHATFTITATGAVDHSPLTLAMDASTPGRVFDGLGGNFRIQNPRVDLAVIAYNLANLRISWARVEMPWRTWDPDLAVDPSLTDTAKLDARIRAAMEMARTAQAKGAKVIVSAWFPPQWAVLGPLPRGGGLVNGMRGNQLDPARMEKIYASLTSYLLYLKHNYGVEAAMFSFNESDLGIDVRQTPQEHADLIKGLGAYMRQRGLTTRMLLGDVSDATPTWFIDAAMKDSSAWPYIGAVSYHSWRGWSDSLLTFWFNAAKQLDVPLLVGEGSIDAGAYRYPTIFKEPDTALGEIELYVRMLALSQPKSILQWQLTSDYSLLVGGGVYGDTSALRPTQRFWNLKQLASTPERVSHVPITCDGAVHCAALMNAREGSLAVHVVNNGASRPAVLTGIPVGITTLRVWRTDTQRAMQEGTPIQVRNGRASVVLDATSYMTLIAKR